jgi:hypothetical protein
MQRPSKSKRPRLLARCSFRRRDYLSLVKTSNMSHNFGKDLQSPLKKIIKGTNINDARYQ